MKMKTTSSLIALALAASLPLSATAHFSTQSPLQPPAPITGPNQVAPLYPPFQSQAPVRATVLARHVAHPMPPQEQAVQEDEAMQPQPPQDATVTIQTLHPVNTPFPPAPAFASLDTNRDGRISHAEAKAYWPLDSDFLYASHERPYVTHAEYRHWVASQDVPTDR